jgi:hypothetical protein
VVKIKTGDTTQMRTLKGWITTTCLLAMLLVSTMTANAGIIIGGELTDQQCTSLPTARVAKLDFGLIIGGLTGIIFGGTGIIIGGGLVDVPTQNCGIIIGGQ